ncbi:hypothetical protein C8A01DRAFT_48726 [Parachaetomium inaequale]|uniref:Kelch repeat-containing protein n=1 Tax=Parachaetomium inaequale TaxID=2588326 RepID=A0AAN6SPN5_9PEZI|nr:hypothetical protein C8A01DRAFT_48726 [Parachaetomium inaequale]
MPYVQLPKSCSAPEIPPSRPGRPRFHHRCTEDRIREGSGRPPSFSMSGKIAKERKSIFRELGLDTDQPSGPYSSEHEFGELTGLASPTSTHAPGPGNDNTSDDGDGEMEGQQTQQGQDDRAEPRSEPASPSAAQRPWYARLPRVRRPRIKTVSSAPPPSMSTITRLSSIALLIAVLLPGFSYYNGREEAVPNLADAGVINTKAAEASPVLGPRADSPTDVCKRWAHQTAQLNGTLYIYGGQATTSKDQTEDTWNNNFLTLDLTKSWDTSSPALRSLPQPSGPPAVSLGYLWNDYNNLYLYGGQFADNPFVEPGPISTWKYSISSQTWTEYSSPRTSAGKNADPGDRPVQRAAEGAGLSVPELGLSWYFGGHLDQSTTPGWSNQIARVYLKSLLEFTHPGYTNDGVFSLADDTGAGEGGAYRNITEGGLQTDDGFPERADGVLVFVPGWGEKGVLIGLAGGSNDTFVNDLSTLDVYDIARCEWYQQKTTGEAPSVRVNPCAVTAAAPDASSFQVYLYGGQNLQPYGEQIQYSDMYILTIPSFTWIKVPRPANSPPARAGHTCTLRDGQIIIVGGYTGNTQSCESPGIHIFNASSLTFHRAFTALPYPRDNNNNNNNNNHADNSVLAASLGYLVPPLVASLIGGSPAGGATASTPAAGPATGGPFATGKAPVFTVTAVSPGSTATVTAEAGSPQGGGGGGGEGDGEENEGGLIAAGVLAGLAGVAAAYLGYCAVLFRRQVRAYRRYLAVVNRYSPPGSGSTGRLVGWGVVREKGERGQGGGGGGMQEKGEQHQQQQWGSVPVAVPALNRFSTSTVDSASLGWGAVPPTEPRFLFDEGRPSLGSGTGSGSGSGSGTAPAAGAGRPMRRSGSVSGGSTSSTERLLDGQEPSFFSVVLGPRRALRVVNGLEGDRDSGGE